MKKLLSFLVFNLLVCSLNAQTWSGSTPGNIYYDQGNVGVGVSSPTQKLDILGSLRVTTEEVLGVAGGLSVQPSSWARPGATRLLLNNCPIYAYDGVLNFFDHASQVFSVSGTGYGACTRKGYVVGGNNAPAGSNESFLAIDASNPNEFYTGSAYPSEENFYRIKTVLNSPIVSTNSNTMAVRAPLCLDARYLKFNAGSASMEAMRITESKNLLIGTSNDNGNKLQANGNIWTTGLILPTNASVGKVLTSDANGVATWQSPAASADTWNLTGNAGTTSLNNFIGTTDNQPFVLKANNISILTVLPDGNVGLGTSDTKGYKLGVAGGIIAEKVRVRQYANWPDYVFHRNYRLRPLQEVEEYFTQHKHLPEVPSAQEVKDNGVDVADMDATLLKKVEELTLYIISQEKRMNKLENENREMRKQLDAIK